MTKPRVIMADDHSLILAGMRRLVEEQCEVVGMVEDGRALVEAAQKLRPDLILMDIAMPLLNGPGISSNAPQRRNSARQSRLSSKANTTSRR